MKKCVLVVASLTAAVAGVASADVKLDFGDLVLGGSASSTLKLDNLSGSLTGFTISYGFNAVGASWASDAAFVLNTGEQWGGYNAYIGGATSFVDFWAFDGPVSAPTGVYSDTRFDTPANSYTYGTSYSFWFGNGYAQSSPVSYKDVTITLFGVTQVPAPGAIALLGLAGLTGRRRRS